MKYFLIFVILFLGISTLSVADDEDSDIYDSSSEEDDIFVGPFLLHFPQEQRLEPGETAEFTCIVKLDKYNTSYSMRWRLHQVPTWHDVVLNTTVKNGDPRFSVKQVKDTEQGLDEWTLTIQNVTRKDDGLYHCKIMRDDIGHEVRVKGVTLYYSKNARLYVLKTDDDNDDDDDVADGCGGTACGRMLLVLTFFILYLFNIT